MTGKTPEFRLEHFLPYLVHRVGSRLAEGFEDRFDEAGLNLQEWRAAAGLPMEADGPRES